jgi:hypothetical protein
METRDLDDIEHTVLKPDEYPNDTIFDHVIYPTKSEEERRLHKYIILMPMIDSLQEYLKLGVLSEVIDFLVECRRRGYIKLWENESGAWCVQYNAPSHYKVRQICRAVIAQRRARGAPVNPDWEGYAVESREQRRERVHQAALLASTYPGSDYSYDDAYKHLKKIAGLR